LIWSPLTPPVAVDAPLVGGGAAAPLVDVLPPELPHAATPIEQSRQDGGTHPGE
jgi:hypothetical protein